jgi:hypothetical protein
VNRIKDVIERFPKICPAELLENSVVPEGWFELVRQQLRRLERFKDVSVRQIKPKFLGLRIYINGPDAAQNIANEYEFKVGLCERCGVPANGSDVGGGAWMTLCEEHRLEERARRGLR